VKKNKIGYIQGVFDLFHIGHLNIIKKAKLQCNYLIVGVSTDELVISYKNKKPVIPFKERIEIISSIKYVDKAVKQISRDKFAAWQLYHFNILFSGDDWEGSEIYQKFEKQLSEVGVEIIYFPYTKTTSSTIIRQFIENFNNNRRNQ